MFFLIIVAFFSFLFSIFSMASFSVHSAVYFIILTFLSSGFVYYLLGSTYLSMILFIVYVGAVAILFIFCIMLLNLRTEQGSTYTFRYYIYSSFIFFSFLVGVYFYFTFFTFNFYFIHFDWIGFDYSFYSKDYSFLSTFFTFYSSYILCVGILLFFVTVAVTSILSLYF